MLFRRSIYLFLGLLALLLARLLLPGAEQWPLWAWLAPMLVGIFLVAPFLVARDIRDGRKTKPEGATELSGR